MISSSSGVVGWRGEAGEPGLLGGVLVSRGSIPNFAFRRPSAVTLSLSRTLRSAPLSTSTSTSCLARPLVVLLTRQQVHRRPALAVDGVDVAARARQELEALGVSEKRDSRRYRHRPYALPRYHRQRRRFGQPAAGVGEQRGLA